MTTKNNKLSDEDLGFLVDTIVQEGKNLDSETAVKRYERLLKRDVCVLDTLALVDLVVNRATEHLMGHIQPMIVRTLEVQQVQDKLLKSLGITTEQAEEAYKEVVAENEATVKAQMEYIKEQRENAADEPTVKDIVDENGLKIKEVQNSVDLSLKQGE